MTSLTLPKVSSFHQIKDYIFQSMRISEDLICHRHSKLKTIFVNNYQLPLSPNQKAFVCENCNPSGNFKFYQQILIDSSLILQNVKKNELPIFIYKLKDFLEKCYDYNSTINSISQEINKNTQEFDSFFLGDIYFKTSLGEELVKVWETLNLISFTNGKINLQQSGGEYSEQEKQYIRLVNILISSSPEYLDFEFKNLTENLKKFIKLFNINHLNYMSKSNDFLTFLTGDFYKFSFTLEKKNYVDTEFLQTLNF